jgi:hypothetical protein
MLPLRQFTLHAIDFYTTVTRVLFISDRGDIFESGVTPLFLMRFAQRMTRGRA